MALICPHCRAEATVEHLRSSPECLQAVRSLWARYRLAKRTTVTRAGGRPATLVACPRCGEKVTMTQAKRGHGCTRTPA